jgi:hypothetical protein
MIRLVIALSLCAAWAFPATAAEIDTPVRTKAIDVVICLDVSNSMDGLIASAKAKLWDIVNELARAKPTPNLRVGLYSYGNTGYDPHVGWVRKELDLTTDLDALYQKLNALTTRGGTEYVTRVCRDAVEQQSWSAEKDALKIIFVCGNEPASQDLVVKLKDAADAAKAKGIVINPIFCGPLVHRDARDWKDFTTLSGGRFTNIDQQRGVLVIATPQDKQLAELSAKLNTTYLPYGGAAREKAANQTAQDQNAATQGAGVAATRAISKSGGLYRNEDWDLVDRSRNDPKFDVKTVPLEDLCEPMRQQTPAQREKHVREMAAQRDALHKDIARLSTERQKYLAQQAKRNPGKADKAFDEAIRGTLRDQAGAKGIAIPK